MRLFALSGYRLGGAPREVRLVYTGFVGFALVGLVTIGLFQAVQIGLRLSEVAAYYHGGETETAMTFPKTFIQLLKVTHFHAFIMGVVFLNFGTSDPGYRALKLLERRAAAECFRRLVQGIWLVAG